MPLNKSKLIQTTKIVIGLITGGILFTLAIGTVAIGIPFLLQADLGGLSTFAGFGIGAIGAGSAAGAGLIWGSTKKLFSEAREKKQVSIKTSAFSKSELSSKTSVPLTEGFKSETSPKKNPDNEKPTKPSLSNTKKRSA